MARLAPAGPELKVVYASGYIEDALSSGSLVDAAILLQKPYRKQDLVRALDRLLPPA
jgi:hypothetical protein